MPYKNPPGCTIYSKFEGNKGNILRLVWSRDGHLLASTTVDQTIQLWNTETWDPDPIRILEGHDGGINHAAWSLDGQTLASCSIDRTIQIWDTTTGKPHRRFHAHDDDIPCIAWSPDGITLASCSADKTIKFWHTYTWELLRSFKGHDAEILYIVWSPDGKKLASCSEDNTIRIWDFASSKLQWILEGHTDKILCLSWSPDGNILASASFDKTIRIWDTELAQQRYVLKGHNNYVRSVSFSSDAKLLASNSPDGNICLWRTDTWGLAATLPKQRIAFWWVPGLAFHPNAPFLASLSDYDRLIRIWKLDPVILLSKVSASPSDQGTTKRITQPPISPSIHYTNAKVMLLGDTGVGKSGLGLVLTGQPFVPTASTHGRNVWTLDSQEIKLDQQVKEMREILLWDLAGQPGYRLVHQLYLDEVTVALVVFDARSETNPFAGVEYWTRALLQAQHVQGSSALPLKKFLVVARADRGGVGVSQGRLQTLVQELGFDGFFETSAQEGWQIEELRESIRKAVDWRALPRVSSTELFQRIKAFLVAQREAGRFLSTVDDLYAVFLGSLHAPKSKKVADLHAQFVACVGRVEAAGLIKRFSFGNLVLLRPEFLDAYASALVNTVKDEPDGLGSITEERARTGDFRVPRDERIKDKEQERLLLIALVEDLLRRELVLHEDAYLVFPSQSTRENPDLPDPEGKAAVYNFEGSVLNIYATLAVRLANSDLFKKKDLWENAVTYTASVGGVCGMFLQNIGEGRGELTLFFDPKEVASEQTRLLFEQYVEIHLQRWAFPETIKRRRIFVCGVCNTPMAEQIVQLRRERGFDWLICPVCGNHISLLDWEKRLVAEPSSQVKEMDRAADRQRDRKAAKMSVRGKEATKDFDVFLCHNGEDKPAVRTIGQQLRQQGILPWLDEEQLRPGFPWQRLLEQQIETIKSVAVLVGRRGRGPWQNMELEAFIREFVRRECPVIPVILPDCKDVPDLPIFLQGMTWVDFRQQDSDPMARLIWGITGERVKVAF